MKSLLIVISLLPAVTVLSATLEILSETTYPIELHLNPVRITDYQIFESGGLRIGINEGSYFNSVSWIIETDSLGNAVTIDADSTDNLPVLSIAEFPGSYEEWIVAQNGNGDTLWKCSLEGTDISFFNQHRVVKLSGGGYLVDCSPDCHLYWTDIQRILVNGEKLWHLAFKTNYLLDFPEQDGEVYPHIYCIKETSSGELLIGGCVSQWITTADASFVSLLEGASGNPVWKIIEYALGEARILDIIETSSGHFVAVGETAESVTPENKNYCIWGARQPLLIVLDSGGNLLNLEVLNPDRMNSFKSIIELEDYSINGNEFLIAGVDSSTCELVLIRACLTDIE